MHAASLDRGQLPNPLVSFVVPCYRLAHMLAQCVGSILFQSFQDFEILVMDNCSPDDTPAVAASFQDPRVRYIRNEVNLGHVRNFNKGIALARGKYVWLVSADDWLRSQHALERYVGVMEANPSAGFVFCRAMEIRGAQEAGITRWADSIEDDRVWHGPAFAGRLIERNCVVMSSVMMRREFLRGEAVFPEDLPYACDWYMWSMLALRHPVAYLSEPMVNWRVHGQSLTTQFKHKDSRICLNDELAVLWRLASAAKAAGLSPLVERSKAAMATRAALALYAAPGDTGAGVTEQDVREMLCSRVRDQAAETELMARIRTALGDEHYKHAEYREAAICYRSGIELRNSSFEGWTKYLLLRTGRIGRYGRRLAAEARQRS